MAGDLAQLGIQVDSSQAKAASGDLDRLASSASGAQKATDGLRDANTSATGATAQSAAATKALRDAIASNATVTAEMIQAAGGWTAAQKIMSDASRNTASTIAKSAETQVAANDAIAASAVESAAVQVAAHGAVAGSSVKIRESLVLLREASVGNYTRMAGSASILIGAFGLMEAVLVPLVAIGGALGATFAIGAEQINKSSGDLTKGLGLTQAQLDKVTQRTVTFKDVALATFQVLGHDLASNFSGVVSDIGKDFDALAYDGELAVAAIAGGFNGTYQGIKATWKMLPSVLGDFFVTAANDALSVLQTLINGSVTGINAVIEANNKMNALFGNGVQMGLIQPPNLGQIKNQYAGAGKTASDAFGTAFSKGFNDASAATTQFFTDVANQAKKNRIADILKEAGKPISDGTIHSYDKFLQQIEDQTAAQNKLSVAVANGTMTAAQAIQQEQIDKALKGQIATIETDAKLTLQQKLAMIQKLTTAQEGLNAAEGSASIIKRIASLDEQVVAQGQVNDALAAGTITYSQAKDALTDYTTAAQDKIVLDAAEASGNKTLIDTITQLISKRNEDTAALRASQDVTTIDETLAQANEQLQLASMTTDQRERETAVLQLQHNLHGQLSTDDANALRDLVAQKQAADQLGQAAQGVTSSFQDFFTNVLSGGKNAFQTLVDSIKSYFIKLLAWMVTQAIAQPIIVPIIGAMTGAAGLGSLTGGTGGIGNLLGSLGTAGTAGTAPAGATGFFGQISTQISSATNWLTSGINSLGTHLGLTATGAGSLTSTLGAAGLGYGLGSMGASLLGGNSSSSQQTNGMIGSALGAAIGSIIPGLGTLLGSALGGVIGGLIGPKESAHRATANFDSNYALTGVTGTKLTDQGQQAATSAAQSVGQVVQALQGAGIHLTNSIDKLTISTSRDQSFVTTSTGQRVNVGKAGDAQAAVSGTIAYLTTGMKSANAQVEQVIQHYKALGGITADNAQQFGDDVTFAKSLASITHQVTFQLGGAADALKQVKAAYDADIERAKSLGVSTSHLLANEQKDIKAMTAYFNASVKSQLLSITDPVLASFDQISAAAKALVSDAKAIGGNLKQAQALNAANLQQFIVGLSDADRAALIASGDLTHSQVLAVKAVRGLSDGIDTLITSATDAASAAQQASQAWTNAQQSLDQSRKALLVSGPGVSPQNAYLAAQQQYADLLKKAKTDPQAASDFASFASQFLQTSLTYNATGGQFGADQAKVQSDLASLSSLAGTQATAATNLATQAQAQVDALNIIKDQLASGGPSLSVLQQQLKTQQGLNATMLAVLDQLGGHRAAGGSVTAGMSYLVGENRAEMFTPAVSGSISPNIAMPSRGASNDNGNAELRAEIRELRAALVSALAENGNGLKRVESAVTKTGGDQVAALSGVKGELKHANGMTSLHGKVRKSRAG